MECKYNNSCSQCTQAYLLSEQDKPFSYSANYLPKDFYWGKLSSKVLYIGLNPYGENIGGNNYSTIETLRQGPGLNSYFGTIQKWVPYLFEGIGKEQGVAFSDLVKCASRTFPLKGMKVTEFDTVFRNCRTHLQTLINEMVQQNLETIIVSGIHPCWHMLDMYFPEKDNSDKAIDNVCLEVIIEGKQINIIFFRKFMGRKDVSHIYRDKATKLLNKVLSKS